MTATVTVSGLLLNPGGSPAANAMVRFTLVGLGLVDPALIVPSSAMAVCDASGAFALTVVPSPPGTYYDVRGGYDGSLVFSAKAVVPHNDCNLTQIIQSTPPAFDAAQQALIGLQALLASAQDSQQAAAASAESAAASAEAAGGGAGSGMTEQQSTDLQNLVAWANWQGALTAPSAAVAYASFGSGSDVTRGFYFAAQGSAVGGQIFVDWGDGSGVEGISLDRNALSPLGGAATSHTYPVGTYQVSMRVVNSFGEIDWTPVLSVTVEALTSGSAPTNWTFMDPYGGGPYSSQSVLSDGAPADGETLLRSDPIWVDFGSDVTLTTVTLMAAWSEADGARDYMTNGVDLTPLEYWQNSGTAVATTSGHVLGETTGITYTVGPVTVRKLMLTPNGNNPIAIGDITFT